MDHIDFGMKPRDIEDPETGKREIYVEDKNNLRKMYKLKHMAEKQTHQQKQQQIFKPNSDNWNFGSPPPSLLKKKQS
ncbi:hypothetical protein [Candidatus Nitrosocosmicus sp. R]